MNMRATIDFDPEIQRALRLKAAASERSLSDFARDPEIPFERVVEDLRRRGKL